MCVSAAAVAPTTESTPAPFALLPPWSVRTTLFAAAAAAVSFLLVTSAGTSCSLAVLLSAAVFVTLSAPDVAASVTRTLASSSAAAGVGPRVASATIVPGLGLRLSPRPSLSAALDARLRRCLGVSVPDEAAAGALLILWEDVVDVVVNEAFVGWTLYRYLAIVHYESELRRLEVVAPSAGSCAARQLSPPPGETDRASLPSLSVKRRLRVTLPFPPERANGGSFAPKRVLELSPFEAEFVAACRSCFVREAATGGM